MAKTNSSEPKEVILRKNQEWNGTVFYNRRDNTVKILDGAEEIILTSREAKVLRNYLNQIDFAKKEMVTFEEKEW